MLKVALKRQLITDITGNAIGVILPLEEYRLVEKFLENDALDQEGEKLRQLELAVHDPMFLQDLYENMQAFAAADGEWWEMPQ
ncbi:MAG: hypothetical protein K1X65_02455 [Caldilineales bacterium]|nr:hypothetical protein [Caldilineales bacterium]MCW5860317.1 hypothetical protein [Caldilineales bacterium]